MVELCTNKCKITSWKERSKTELPGRSPLRRRGSALEWSAIWEEEDEEEGGGGQKQQFRPKIQTGWTPGVKRPGCESDYSPPYSTEVKNEWTATSTPFCMPHGVCKDSFTCSSLEDYLNVSFILFKAPDFTASNCHRLSEKHVKSSDCGWSWVSCFSMYCACRLYCPWLSNICVSFWRLKPEQNGHCHYRLVLL